MKKTEAACLLGLSFGALLVHGYHPAIEDAEIYIPGIVKILHPSHYPFGQEFFETHAHLTLFPNLIAETVRLTHLSLPWALFLWHFASIFLFLLACWRIAAKCFPTAQGRWCAVALVAALLTLPVAGTALYIFDQYLNPRSFSILSVIFAIDAALETKYARMILWLIVTAVIHPLMTVFGLTFIFLLIFGKKITQGAPASLAALFFAGLPFKSPSQAYWQSLSQHRYYFLLRWEWYEWLGIVAPLALLWWFRQLARRSRRPIFESLSWTATLFGLIFFAAGTIVTIPRSLEILAVYQPMRSLQLVYVFLILFSGGLLGERLFGNRPLRWAILFVPLCAGMCFAQFQLFPGTRHVEWPGTKPKNPWTQAFLWIRANTPENAVFALDPDYMALPNENYEGFRAIAERSRLADDKKDWSAVVMYPWLPLADHCLAQIQAARHWKNFHATDFERLKESYGVTWVVVQQSAANAAQLNCPYQNRAVRICRLN